MSLDVLSEGHSMLVFILSDCIFQEIPWRFPHTPQLQHKRTYTGAAHPLVPKLLSPSFFTALFPPTQRSSKSHCRTEQALYCVHFHLRPPSPVCVTSQGSSEITVLLCAGDYTAIVKVGRQLWVPYICCISCILVIWILQNFLRHVQRLQQSSPQQDRAVKLGLV